MPQPGPPLFDVQTLLDASEPKPRINWFWYGVGAFLLVSLVGAYISESSPTGRMLVEGGSVLLTIGVIGGMSLVTAAMMRKIREAQLRLEAAGELVQLRRWPQASLMLTQILSQPSRTHAMRFEALLYLTSVLARYDRFDDAIVVQDHLLEANLDPTTERALKLGRAMAMLRLDRLFDADRAIADLRRGEARDTSGGLALVELYRDVKTGHPAEAIETFNLRLPLMRDQLAHRVADAYVLAAKAYDQLGETADAAKAFHNATLLAEIDELVRRCPEVADLPRKYAAARSPDATPTGQAPTPSPGTPGEGVGEGSAGSRDALASLQAARPSNPEPAPGADGTLTLPSPGIPGEGQEPSHPEGRP